MTRILIALLCFAALSSPAFADTCLNTDKEKYADNDNRSSDYGKCKPAPGAPDNSYNSLSIIGKQMQGMMEREDRSDSRREMSASDRDSLYARDRSDFANSPYSILCEVQACIKKPSPYPNAATTPEQQQAIRDEIAAAKAQGKLLETYGGDAGSLAKKWIGGSDPVANWKQCEVAATLVRAYVNGDGVTPAQKDPAKGFAIARAGCDASCGGTCLELGRIFVAGNDAAPGVDKVLGRKPQEQTVYAYEVAIRNGITAAYRELADINRTKPPRYEGKTYFDLIELDTYSYWINSDTDRRIAYRQYQKCLKADPANLACASGINALLKNVTPNSGYNFTLAGDVTEKDIAFYREYQQKLEALIAAAGNGQAPAAAAP